MLCGSGNYNSGSDGSGRNWELVFIGLYTRSCRRLKLIQLQAKLIHALPDGARRAYVHVIIHVLTAPQTRTLIAVAVIVAASTICHCPQFLSCISSSRFRNDLLDSRDAGLDRSVARAFSELL